MLTPLAVRPAVVSDFVSIGCNSCTVMPASLSRSLSEPVPPTTLLMRVVRASATGASPLGLAASLGAVRSLGKDFEHDDLVRTVKELTGLP